MTTRGKRVAVHACPFLECNCSIPTVHPLMSRIMQVNGECVGMGEDGREGEMRAVGIQPCSSSVCAREWGGGADVQSIRINTE